MASEQIDISGILSAVSTAQATQGEFDLDNWITDFENGFQGFTKLNPEYQAGYWGQTADRRPKILELNVEPNAQITEGYRVVEFFPDRDNKDESYMLFGTPIELMTQVTMMMNIKKMLRFHSSDEQWVGSPLDEYLRAKPRNELAIQINLTTRKEPPFYKRKLFDGTVPFYKRHYITIPAIDRSLITYKKLRELCNNSAGLDFGEWQSRAYISEHNDSAKGIHQAVCYGSTEEKAKANLKRFLQLTTLKIRKITVTKVDLAEGDTASNPDNKSLNSYEVYPGWVCVFNPKLLAYNDARGRATLLGKQINSKPKRKLYIYQETEPSWFAPMIQDAIKERD